MPEIPYHLSTDAKNFISLCLRREPSARPLACQLLHHPFIRNPSPVNRETNMKIMQEAFPNFDGICTPVSSHWLLACNPYLSIGLYNMKSNEMSFFCFLHSVGLLAGSFGHSAMDVNSMFVKEHQETSAMEVVASAWTSFVLHIISIALTMVCLLYLIRIDCCYCITSCDWCWCEVFMK